MKHSSLAHSFRTFVLSAMAIIALATNANAQLGHASVYTGVAVSPGTVTLDTNFTVSFTLREISGQYRSFDSIAVAILRADGTTLFDLATWNNVTIGANLSWSQSPTGQIYYSNGANPPGTYKAIVRGKLVGGNWFDFDTAGSGVNPKSFTVVGKPDISVSPGSTSDSVTIGNYIVKTVTVTNSGSATLNVTSLAAAHDNPTSPAWIGSFNPSTLSVPAGSSRTFTFNINALNLPAGARTGRVLIYSNDPDTSPATVNVTMNVVAPAAPNIVVSPTSTQNDVTIGSYLVKTVTVTNTGNATLNVTSLAAVHDSPASPAWIGSFNPSTLSVAAGSSGTFTFNINALNLPAGTRTGRVLIYSNDPDTSPATVNVTMNVVAPAAPNIVVSPTSTQNDVTIGSYLVKTVTVTNTGNATLNVTSLAAVHDSPASPAWIGSFNPSTLSVAAGSSGTFTFNINALNLPAGTRTGRVLIYSNDPDTSPATVNVTMNVVAPAAPNIVVSPTSTQNDVTIGSYLVKTVTVTNTGNATLNVTSLAAVHDSPASPAWIGSFNPSTLSVAAGSSGTFTFNINALNLPAGTRTGRVLIYSNDPDTSPATVNVTMNVVAPAAPNIVVSPTSTQNDVTIGSYLVKTVTVTNTGNATLNVTSLAAAHDSPASPAWIGSFNPSTLSVAAGSSGTFTFNINALNLPAGTRTGRVLIYSNDPDTSPATIDVTMNVVDPVEPDGFVSIADGIDIVPVPVVLGQQFAAIFTLHEWEGHPISFEQIEVGIWKNGVPSFVLKTYSNVAFAAHQTRAYQEAATIPVEYGPGSYSVLLRGRVTGGSWFEFSTIDNAVNPRAFPVSRDEDLIGYASVSSGVSVPTPVQFDDNFAVNFAIKEVEGKPITFAWIKAVVLRGDLLIRELATYNNVAFAAGQTRNYAPTGSVPSNGGQNQPDTYSIQVRGSMDGVGWFVFTSTNSGVNPRSFTVQQHDLGGYHAYFEEAGAHFGVPFNLLKAVAQEESHWDPAARGGNGWGMMQLEEATHLTIAQRLKSEYPGDYSSMSDEQVVELLRSTTSAGVQANIRGGASKLRWDADNVNDPDLVFTGEPLEALETWWFVLAYYNGGGGDLDLTSSNYPFRVYNWFLAGVPEDGGRVPQIAITLPPHFYFRKATGAEIASGEVVPRDAGLIPHTPPNFIRVVPPFDVCADMGHLHDNWGSELNLGGCQPVPFRMSYFPLDPYTADNAPMNSVYDYSSPDYSNDLFVIDYRAEVGEQHYGAHEDGYRQADTTKPFVANGNYKGIGLPLFLFYDGHIGYDYRTGSGASLRAPADGVFHWDGGYYGVARIDHANGYQTEFWHCSSYVLALNGQSVMAGTVVAYSGEQGAPGQPHLHFEVLKNGRAIDPYGWQANEAHAWTPSVNHHLWYGTAPRNLSSHGVSSSTVDLDWSMPLDGDSPSSYQVYRREATTTVVEYIAAVPGYSTAYRDNLVQPDVEYVYFVTAASGGVESAQSNEASAVVTATTDVELPARVTSDRLYANYPNPFNPVTNIRYDLLGPAYVDLRVYDIAGRLVSTVVAEQQAQGQHVVQWHGRDDAGRRMASGVYFYRLSVGRYQSTERMVLLK